MEESALPVESVEVIRQVDELPSYVLGKFQAAREAKTNIEARLVDCLERFQSRYSPSKLKEIEEIGAPPIYIPLTSIKCRALTAWLVDILFQPNLLPYDIKPTPVPDLPEDMIAELSKRVYETVKPMIGLLPPETFIEMVRETQDLLKIEIKEEIEKKSRELCERFKKQLDDELIEGGFLSALSDFCIDIAIFPTAIIKGGVKRKERGYVRTKSGLEPKDKIVYTFERVSPFNIFPSPHVPDFSDYVIEVLNLLPSDIANLRSVEGFDRNAIDNVLEMYASGYRFDYRNYPIPIEPEAFDSSYPYIDVLEYWGPIPGRLLKQWRAEGDINDSEYYEAVVWVVDKFVLKAMLNNNPLGMKPYSKASFIEVPGSFWGQALPEVLSPLQDSVNAIARAIAVNAVLASGPIVERNIDRVDPSQPKMIIPWSIYDAHDSALNSAPAFRFNSIPLTAPALSQVLALYLKMADETSGIPAYAHGDLTVGGAGRTYSGLSMLTANATRGIKAVLRNIDEGVIAPIVERQYYSIATRVEPSFIPDLKIQAKGSIALAEKEMEATKALEFLRIITNPLDQGLMPMEGRKKLLEIIARSMGMDPEVLFQDSSGIDKMLQQTLGQEAYAQMAQTASPEAPSRAIEATHQPLISGGVLHARNF